MMKTLLVVAEMKEAEPLIRYYSMLKISNAYINLWSSYNHDLCLIVTGPGINNVISSLSKAVYLNVLNTKTNIINVGYAGAKGLNIGEVIYVKNCHCLEFPIKANTKVENCIKLSNEGYDCYTSFDFVEKAETIEEKVLFDMELAYIARFVYNSLYSIKIVSDNLSYDGFKSFDGNKAWKEVIEKIEERRKVNVSGNVTA